MPCGLREDDVLYLIHCKSMGGIRCHGNQSSDPNWPLIKCNHSAISIIITLLNNNNSFWLHVAKSEGSLKRLQ